jgi:soluble lytic murein transglycosylase-like protein
MDAFILALTVAAHTFSLPVGLQSAICYVESKHNLKAFHAHDGNGNSVGACQIKLNTARQMGFKGTEKELFLPKNNVHYSAKYLKSKLDLYHRDIRKAVAAYNAGTWRKNELGKTKNDRYVRAVFKAWVENK